MSTEDKFTFRSAIIDDIKLVCKMIQDLADFENMRYGPSLTEDDLIKDSGLSGGREYCHIYVLDYNTTDSVIQAIGYAICFPSYSTWHGRTYFLEDIYVRPEYRGIGAGKRIFTEVSKKAKELGCKRLDFHVLEWNPARKFYEKLGAIDITIKEKWHFYRLDGDSLDKLASFVSN